MQLVKLKSNIVEKILRDKEGRLVRARFCVYENDGRIKARLIDFTFLEENPFTTLTLSGNITENKYFETIFEKGFVSPFFNSKTLYSSGSKPRAPTFA